MTSSGVSRSLRLTTAKSFMSGAPRQAAAALAAVTPGTTSTVTGEPSGSSSSTSPAMPYTPASPVLMTATRDPAVASATAASARVVSWRMPLATVRLPATRSATSSRYGL